MHVTTIGIDLAKNTFSLAGSDKHQKIVLRKTLMLPTKSGHRFRRTFHSNSVHIGSG